MIVSMCQCYSPSLSHPPISLSVNKFVLYICISILARQIGSSVPFRDPVYFNFPSLNSDSCHVQKPRLAHGWWDTTWMEPFPADLMTQLSCVAELSRDGRTNITQITDPHNAELNEWLLFKPLVLGVIYSIAKLADKESFYYHNFTNEQMNCREIKWSFQAHRTFQR